MPAFKSISQRAVRRARSHLIKLGRAKTQPDQLRALFLAHCSLKDIETKIAKPK